MISERAGVLDEDVDALGPTHVAQSLDPAEEYQSADFGLDGELSVAAPVPTPDFEDAVARLEARGGIEAHVNRYGSDPTKCPFFRQMGAAGLKLAGEIETSAKNPNRGKTIAELLAE